MAVILVTGTPATGKTTLAKGLAKELKYRYIDVHALIVRNRLSDGYDKKRETDIVDTDRLNKELIKTIKRSKNLIIDSHLSHYLPPEQADICLVTKCSLKELKRRLEARYDDADKVKENLESEIFDICYNEAQEMGHRTRIVRTTNGINMGHVKKLVAGII
jgi:adenylate kinase